MKTKTSKGIFGTLITIHLVAIIFLVVLVGSFSCLKNYRVSKRDLERHGRLAASILRLVAVDPIVNRLAYDRIHELVRNVDQENPDIVNVLIYDTFGEPVAYSTINAEPALLSKEELHDLYLLPRDTLSVRPSLLADFEFVAVLSIDEDVVGFARVCVSTDRIDAALVDDITFFIGSALLSLALSAFIYFYFINRRIVHPLQGIAATMEEFGRSKNVSFTQLPEELSSVPLCSEIEKMHHSFQQMVMDIVSRNKALHEKEEKIRLLLNSTAEAIYGLDTDGRCTFCNVAFLRMFGYGKEEVVLGKIIHDLIHHTRPDGLPYPFVECKAHQSFLQGKPAHSNSEVFFRADGSFFPVEYWSHPICDGGQVTGAVVTCIDITARQLAETARRKSEEQYRSLVENINMGITLIDRDHNIVMANAAQGKMFSKATSEFIGKKCFQEFEKRDHVCPHCPGIGAMVNGCPEETITQGQRDDGSTFTVKIKAFPLQGEKGEITGFIEVVEDITEQLKARQDLAAEKERLSVTLRSIGDGVITTDTQGTVGLVNKAAEELIGWTHQEALDKPLLEVFDILNEEDREQYEDPVKKVLSSGQVVGLASQTILTSRDGVTRSIAHSSAPIRDQQGEIVGVVIVFRDITEQLRTERELIKVRKLESVGVLAGGIAHDFNNILAAILGNINLALLDTKLDGATKDLLTEAEKASIRAKKLTQQLLTFARGGEPIKEVSSLHDVIKDTANFVLHGDKVACRFDIPDSLWLVNIDKGQISQVIQNIVQNASHAMPKGGTITIACENISSDDISNVPELPTGKYVKICIQDTGIGMPENVIDKIFDPYFSTKKEGSGLGLAITHSIISKHGGHISVDSSLYAGTTLTLYLPASEYKKMKSQKSEVLSNTSVKAKILIMDDEEIIRRVAKAMLLQLGHEVDVSEDGNEALRLYQDSIDSKNKFDLVIMDLTIPGGMGGKEAIHVLLQLDPHAKVIVSSGYSNDPVMSNCEEYGFCAAIEKPYQLQEMSRLINKLLA